MITRSTSLDVQVTPNDWVEYVTWDTGTVVHIDDFYNPALEQHAAVYQRPAPPGGWAKWP